jgi:predicted NBD/HSP70 family sugar kinase
MELDPVRKPGAGRPTRPISLDGEPWCVLGVHIDVDAIRVVATTLGGRELWTDTVGVNLRMVGAAAGLPVVEEVLRAQVRRIPTDTQLVSIEIALPGYIIADRGVVSWSQMLDWRDVPLRDRVAELLVAEGISGDVHIGIGNDCQLAALYASRMELELEPHGVVVYFGGYRQVGSGVIIEGRTFGGAHGGAGDLGHHQVEADGALCWCGRTGCLQTVIGPAALLTRSGLMGAAEAEAAVCDDPGPILHLLADRAAAGDAGVRRALAQAGEALGQVIDDVLGVLNPHAVVLGGYLGMFADYLIPAVEERIGIRLATMAFASTQVRVLPVEDQRVVCGAAMAARDACLADPLRLTRIVA